MKALAFVHGWGTAPWVWDPLAERLPQACLVRLPGHAGCAMRAPGADAWSEAILEQLPPAPVVAVGWSLGGMLLVHAAIRAPSRFAALVLVGAAARFVRAADWLEGADPDVIARLRAMPNAQAMLRAFYRWCAPNEAKEWLARMRAETPSKEALAAGLQLLATLDLRDALSSLDLDTFWIVGRRDRVLSWRAAAASAVLARRFRFASIADAGHAPM
ncbi:MAG: alpha/beta fold hydrolase, partial [Zetaproteobacteria bacterium]